MGAYVVRRLLLAIPIMLGVALVCFMLVHLAPGDPLVSVLPPDASQELRAQMIAVYGFDKPLPVQFFQWLWHAVQGDLGTSIATSRPVFGEVMTAAINSLRLAALATLIGFFFGCLFGFVAGYFQDTWVDKLASAFSVFGVSVPHYWLGMLLVIVFASQLYWLPATGGGPMGAEGWAWDWEHLQFMVLPAITLSVIPTGIIARTVRALVADTLGQEFIVGLRAKGMTDYAIFWHVVKNAAPTALAVMGLQLGYLMGGSILVETVFAWPGTGLLLNSAIFQRDLPLLQGTIWVLALFFVLLNLGVDILQTLLDPRIKRG
ncbi:ABC transporter permease [Stutzerimonas nosocomialis]|uniref:ABC transporter permease n=1 Tax=Stutzerimonas nosocomialis TaxID=1056496 RepID=A0A5R9QF85_9GAMM|nr:ABC transporter permease [Stutzerimonas nosocomialis]TLX56910.1 ABC transporter permease [Stutzerimonas nosocomialis]TLX58638.1 ABC transporter permease [Stutzerimonas nosocomialis]TLX63660.1 ABC transporter permease [Stutzerimonas nosocomialis]